jgi:hypothetical protein
VPEVAPTVALLTFVYWRHGHGAGAACWFVPECNQHQGADGNGRVDDCRENPCRCGAVSNHLHQIAQRQELHGESPKPDDCNSTDRPAVNPAGCPCADGEGDAVHGSKESYRWHSRGTDLNNDARDVRQHGVRDVADEANYSRPDQEAPKEPDSAAVIPMGDFSLGAHRAPSPL